MSRAIFFVAILIVIAYVVFYKNVRRNVPPPGNVEQKYIKQSGDENDK